MRNKKFFAFLAMAALVIGTLVPVAMGERRIVRAAPDFTLVNNSGRTIVNVYLSPSKYADWAPEDELNDRPLRHGESIEIDFVDRWDHIQPYDLRVEYSNGTYDEWMELDLYHIYEMGIERNGASSYLVAD